MNVETEIARLSGPRSGGDKSEFGVIEIRLEVESGASELLARCHEVLLTIDRSSFGRWPSHEEWAKLLPQWLVAKFRPESETTHPSAESASADWSMENWIAWFIPDEREWFWWDGFATDKTKATILVETFGDPAPLGSLQWLLKCAGASAIEII